MGTLAKRNSTSHINAANATGVVLVDPSGSTPFGTTAPLPVNVHGAGTSISAAGSASGDAIAQGNMIQTAPFLRGYNGTTWDRLRTVSGDQMTTGILAAMSMVYDGANYDRPRTPDTFKPFSVTVASIGTGQTVWTVASTNKRFRLLGFAVTSDKAVQVNFKDGSVATIFSTPVLVAATPFGVSGIGNGMLSASANNLLQLDVSASVPAVISGTIWGTEEV